MRNPLFVPELFHYILDYLATSSSGGPGNLDERKTLAALAQTCSAFSKPSLDRLWRRLDSLLPLVRTFASIVDEDTVKTPPSPQEWLVIHRYAYRIREITLGTEYLSLHFLECTHLVLPNLKVLKWDSAVTSTDRSVGSLLLLLTPKIVTLDVALCRPSELAVRSFLENVASLSPNVKSIGFDCLLMTLKSSRTTTVTLSTTATQALSRAICSRRDWHRVRLSCAIDDVALCHLGLSSTLRVASVVLDPEATRPDEGCFGRSEVPFRHVTSLALTVWRRLDVATHLLRPHDQAFQAFKVTLRNTQTSVMDVHALLAAIVSPRRISSLQSLVVRRSRRHRHVPMPGEVQGLSYETLRPIVSLVHLRELNITLNYPITIDDDEFAGLVSNWPHLRVFRLVGKCEESAKAISLKGLLSLLVGCPKLHEIGLSLDAREVPSEGVGVVGAGPDMCRPTVKRLSFQDSLITHPEEVGKFLLRHLPGVHRVTAGFVMFSLPQRRKLMRLWGHMNFWMRTTRERDTELIQHATTSVPEAAM